MLYRKRRVGKIRAYAYQLVILDAMMPGTDGLETPAQIRQESSLPILMLMAKNDSVSKVMGLRQVWMTI